MIDTEGMLAEWEATTQEVGTPLLRRELIDEEAFEAIEAIDEMDREHIAKELADLVYVAYGTASFFNIPLDECITEVHRSNLTKAKGGIVRNEAGKMQKGPLYEEADIASILRRHDDKI